MKTIREDAQGAEERAWTVMEFVLLMRVVVVELRMPSLFAFPFANVKLRGMSKSTCATQSPCIISSVKSGNTWTHIGVQLFASFDHPQKLIFSHRKGLDAQQTAFAMKKIQISPPRWSAEQNLSFHKAVTHS